MKFWVLMLLYAQTHSCPKYARELNLKLYCYYSVKQSLTLTKCAMYWWSNFVSRDNILDNIWCVFWWQNIYFSKNFTYLKSVTHIHKLHTFGIVMLKTIKMSSKKEHSTENLRNIIKELSQHFYLSEPASEEELKA